MEFFNATAALKRSSAKSPKTLVEIYYLDIYAIFTGLDIVSAKDPLPEKLRAFCHRFYPVLFLR